MGFFVVEHGEYLADYVEKPKGHDENCERPSKSLLERLPIVRDNGHMIVHEAGEGQRESLPADHDIPAHHEDSEEYECDAQHRSPYGQPGKQEQDEGHEISDAVLHDEYVLEIPLVDNASEHIPGLQRGVSPEDKVENFKADGGHEEGQKILRRHLDNTDLSALKLFLGLVSGIRGLLALRKKLTYFHAHYIREHAQCDPRDNRRHDEYDRHERRHPEGIGLDGAENKSCITV